MTLGEQLIAEQQIIMLNEGQDLVLCDMDLDNIAAIDDEIEVRSIPNPNRCGIYDKYLCWVGNYDKHCTE